MHEYRPTRTEIGCRNECRHDGHYISGYWATNEMGIWLWTVSKCANYCPKFIWDRYKSWSTFVKTQEVRSILNLLPVQYKSSCCRLKEQHSATQCTNFVSLSIKSSAHFYMHRQPIGFYRQWIFLWKVVEEFLRIIYINIGTLKKQTRWARINVNKSYLTLCEVMCNKRLKKINIILFKM